MARGALCEPRNHINVLHATAKADREPILVWHGEEHLDAFLIFVRGRLIADLKVVVIRRDAPVKIKLASFLIPGRLLPPPVVQIAAAMHGLLYCLIQCG